MDIRRVCARTRSQLASGALLLACAAACAGGPTAPEAPAGAPVADPWFAAGREAVARRAAADPPGRARNAILFVGDGMGVSTVTAARILQGQLRGEPGEENWLSFERLPHAGLARTYNTDRQVPDSAGTMTAMMSGVKTRSGVIGLDARVARGDAAGASASHVPTLLEQAGARGMATGVVSTARITHATPAACYAHVPDRDWEDDSDLDEAARAAGAVDIAAQLLAAPHPPRVVLGGGRARFLPAGSGDPEYPGRAGRRGDGRDLTREWVARDRGASTSGTRSSSPGSTPRPARPCSGSSSPPTCSGRRTAPRTARGSPRSRS